MSMKSRAKDLPVILNSNAVHGVIVYSYVCYSARNNTLHSPSSPVLEVDPVPVEGGVRLEDLPAVPGRGDLLGALLGEQHLLAQLRILLPQELHSQGSNGRGNSAHGRRGEKPPTTNNNLSISSRSFAFSSRRSCTRREARGGRIQLGERNKKVTTTTTKILTAQGGRAGAHLAPPDKKTLLLQFRFSAPRDSIPRCLSAIDSTVAC